jgi:ABC-2 type transport system permease protein
MILKYLLEKEFKQFRRNPIFPRLMVAFPILIIFVFPWVTTFEVQNIKVTVVDDDNSTLSHRLTHEIENSRYFNLVGAEPSYQLGLADVEKGTADVVLDIPRDFEKNMIRRSGSNIQISANAVNGIKGNIGSSYLNAIVAQFATKIASEHGLKVQPAVNVITQNRFNEYLDYKKFMIPALITMVLILLCGFFPTLNIVSEKEIGTIEQINVTPVGKASFIIAKLIPYWAMGLIVFTVCFFLAWLTYGFAPQGNVLLIYLDAVLFIMFMSGFGLVVSNNSATMQQAMFVMFFCIMVFILMSGLFTPIHSMPQWAQDIAFFNPPRYYIEIMRSVFLKGSNFMENWFSYMMLAIFDLLINFWAILSYRKQN